jgi:hypothetical protein
VAHFVNDFDAAGRRMQPYSASEWSTELLAHILDELALGVPLCDDRTRDVVSR